MKQIEKRNWNFNNASLAYILAIAGYFCASIILTFIVLLASGGQAAGSEEAANNVLSQPWITYLNIILSELSFLLVFLICNRKNKKEFLVASRIKFKPNIWIILGTVVASLVLFFGSTNSSEMFTQLFSTFAKAVPELAVPLGSFGQFLLSVLLLALLPAVCEELLFRGLIFQGLKSKFKAIWAIVLSAALFSLMHMSIYQTLHQFVLGVVLATLTYFTGTIAYSIIFHFVNNFIVIFLAYAFPNVTFTFAAWGTREVLISLAIFALAVWIVVLLGYILRIQSKNKAQKSNNVNGTNWQEIIAEIQQSCSLYEISAEQLPDEENDGKTKKTSKNMAEDNCQKPHESDKLTFILLATGVAIAIFMWILNSF